MSDQIKAPTFPEALRANTRRAARAIVSTVQSAIETMTECADIINRYRAGESAIVSRLEQSQTEEAAEWRRVTAKAIERDKTADEEYAAAIKPFQEARDAAKKETAAYVAETFKTAVAAEQLPDDQKPPTVEEHAEAVQDWTASVKQIRDAQRNAKNQLSLEFTVDIANIGTGRESGGATQWRPRFSAATVNGHDLGESPILTDIVAEIPGMSRDLFIGQMLKHLGKGPNGLEGRDLWESFDTGTVLPLSFSHNDKAFSLQLTKAAPIVRKRADGSDEVVADDDSDSDSAVA